MIEFSLTNENKKKGRRNRIKKEKKWLPAKILSYFLICFSAVSFIVGIFFVPYEWYRATFILSWCFAVTLILFVVIRAVINNMASHWIQDRLNQKLWYNEGQLFHFLQTAFSGGLNYRHADSTAYLFVMDVSSIRDIVYDDKSKRIEFHADGTGYHFANYRKNIIDKKWPLKGYPAIFYDCSEPQLIDFLREQGKDITVQTLDFKIVDKGI